MQPKNRPENLTPPNRGPAYVPRKDKLKVIVEIEGVKVKWHKYPAEKPPQTNVSYLVTKDTGYFKYVCASFYDPEEYEGGFYGNEYVKAWAKLPEPYEEEE